MRRILALTLFLQLAATTHAQPSRDDIIRAQHTVLDRLAPLTFVRSSSIESFDKNGRRKAYAAYVRRYVSRDDGSLYAEPVPARLDLYGVMLTRLDEDAGFLPVFVTTASRVTFEREDGALYVLGVERLNGVFGFEGRVWVTGGGFVALAEGRCVPRGLKRGEAPLRFRYTARAHTYLPSEVVEDDVAGGRRVKIVSRYSGYRRFRSDVTVVEQGDEP